MKTAIPQQTNKKDIYNEIERLENVNKMKCLRKLQFQFIPANEKKVNCTNNGSRQRAADACRVTEEA